MGFSLLLFFNSIFKNEEKIYCLTFVGDDTVSENLPNEKIDTGHSCETTAEAQNVIARLKYQPILQSSLIRTPCIYMFAAAGQTIGLPGGDIE